MKKWQTKKTRVFDGKDYSRSYHFATKRDALHFANKSRNMGYLCRIVRHADTVVQGAKVACYTVYRRQA